MADAVVVFEVIVGYDPADPVTESSKGKVPENYSQFLDRDGLRGARIGVARQLFEPEETDPVVLKLMNQAIADLRTAGATLVDPVKIEGLKKIRDSFKDSTRLKHDFNRYLASLGPNAPYKTLEEIIDSKKYHPHLKKRLIDAQAEEPPDKNPKNQNDLRVAQKLRKAVLKAFDESNVDVLVYPTYKNAPRLIGDLNTPYGSNSSVVAPKVGFPAINVPMGFINGNLPAGLQFLGRPFSESTLIKLGYSYEQATRHWRPPPTSPPLY